MWHKSMQRTSYTTLLTEANRGIENVLFLRGTCQHRQKNHIKQNYALIRRNYCRKKLHNVMIQGPAGLAVKPLGLHMVNVGSITTGPTHGEA